MIFIPGCCALPLSSPQLVGQQIKDCGRKLEKPGRCPQTVRNLWISRLVKFKSSRSCSYFVMWPPPAHSPPRKVGGAQGVGVVISPRVVCRVVTSCRVALSHCRTCRALSPCRTRTRSE
jgi:hypothetical protein